MITLFKKTISKQIHHINASLTPNQNHSHQDVSDLLSLFYKNIQTNLATITDPNEQKLSYSKNLIKKTNKAFNDYKINSQQKILELTKQNLQFKNQLQRSKTKIQQLIKNTSNYQQIPSSKQENISFEKGIQCQMKDQEMEKMLEEREKQNIFLKQRISKLQHQLNQSKQDIEGANVLIKQLVRQLQTNMADRQTWYGTGSSNASEQDSLDRIGDSDESFESDSGQILDQMEQGISEASVCRGAGEDCSTIDGSQTTHKDYALPEWVQFGQMIPRQSYLDEEEEELKMWPELLWGRILKILGKDGEI